MQTIKYTVTAQTGYDITVSLVYPDLTTEVGVHFDIHPISVTVAANGHTGATALADFNAWLFPQVIARWQGNLAALAAAAAAQSLAAIIGVQETVTQ